MTILTMKKILCSKQGKIQKYVFVDDSDYGWLVKFRWSAHCTRGGLWCAERSHKGKMQKMHRLILKAKKGQEIDHLNRNGLDNRRSNIRICTRSENLINRGLFKNKKNSIYFGVIKFTSKKHNRTKPYAYKVVRNNKIFTKGMYRTAKEASLAREEFVRNLSTVPL